jgi:hypothetical protein
MKLLLQVAWDTSSPGGGARRHVRSGVKTGPDGPETALPRYPPETDIVRPARLVRFVPILLQKSVEGVREQ